MTRPLHMVTGAVALLAGAVSFACGGGRAAPSPLVVAEVEAQTPSAPTPAPAPGPVYDAVGDPESYLVEDFGQRERRRALMRRAGDLFWDIEAAEGGYVDLRAQPERQIIRPEVIVAERHARHLRVVRSSRGLRATYYLATEDFHDLAVRRATLLTTGGEAFADGCGVTLPAGARLEAQPPDVGYRRVAFRRSWISAEGVAAEGDVDVVYRLEDEPPAAAQDRGAACKIRAPFTLRDAPSGRVVAELVGDEVHFCTATEDARDGARRIAFTQHDVRLVGYVPAAKVQERDPLGLGDIGTIGRGGGSGWASSHTTYLYLSPGDAIFTSTHHLRIGTVVEQDFKVGDDGEQEGWARARFPFQHWDFDVFHITPGVAQAGRERAAEISRGR